MIKSHFLIKLILHNKILLNNKKIKNKKKNQLNMNLKSMMKKLNKKRKQSLIIMIYKLKNRILVCLFKFIIFKKLISKFNKYYQVKKFIEMNEKTIFNIIINYLLLLLYIYIYI
jgi:hypothetical protein